MSYRDPHLSLVHPSARTGRRLCQTVCSATEGMLAGLLEEYRGRPDVIVLGLPRGGVPVAFEVATALGTPLDVFLVRKLGTPGREELAMGAIASGGVMVINDDVVRGLAIAPEAIQRAMEREGRELMRREQAYREGRPFPAVAGTVVIVVDDGLATGSSMRAAIEGLRSLRPARIVVAVPPRRSPPAGNSPRWPTRWSALRRLRRFPPSGAPIGISPRRPMKRSATCFARRQG